LRTKVGIITESPASAKRLASRKIYFNEAEFKKRAKAPGHFAIRHADAKNRMVYQGR